MLLRQLLVASFALASFGAVAQTTKKDSKSARPAPAPVLELPPALPPLPPPEEKKPASAAPNAFLLGIYRLVPAGTSDDPGLQSIEDTFLDVAQASRRYRSVVKLNKPPKLCELEDDNCFALLGGFQQLDQVLVGEILRLENGAAVKVRLIDVRKGKAIGEKALTVQTEDKNEIKSWAEALACDLLNNTQPNGGRQRQLRPRQHPSRHRHRTRHRHRHRSRRRHRDHRDHGHRGADGHRGLNQPTR